MIEWIIGLATMLLIFLVATWTLVNRCLSMYEDIKKLERQNEDLRYSVKALKAENDKLHSRVFVSPEAERMTALKLSLHLKNEEIEELREKLRRQNQLLKQKWEGSRKGGIA
jgi:cell division protein FtsL